MQRLLFILISLLTLSPAAWGQRRAAAGRPDTLRVLAIGNSFSEDAVEQYLWEIGHEAGVELIIGNLYHGGCSLERHAANLRGNVADYAYRKIVGGVKTDRPATTLRYGLRDEAWDVVTLQQASHFSGVPRTYEPYLTQLLDSLPVAAPTALLAWHATWAYSADSRHEGFKTYGHSQMTMYSAILAAVSEVFVRHPQFSAIIPSGTAIQIARRSSLGDTLCRDGYHLNLLYGRYCAALTWAETLLGIDARKVKWVPEGVTADEATAVRKAAHKAVRRTRRMQPL